MAILIIPIQNKYLRTGQIFVRSYRDFLYAVNVVALRNKLRQNVTQNRHKES